MWQAADAEVSEEGFCRDVGEFDLLVQPCLPQLVCGVEQELVGGAEATRTLGGRDDDVTRVIQEPAPGDPRPLGLGERGDGVGVLLEPGNDVVLVAVAGGDDQVVVAELPAGVGRDLPRDRVDFRGRRVDELDAVGLQGRCDREGDVGAVPLAER